MKTAEAPFPFTSMFQNGPRRQGSAPQTLFKPGKDFPPPRKNRAPLPAPGRSENLALEKGKGANAKPKPFSVRSLLPPPFGRHRRHPVMLTRPRNPKIRSPPLDDVNNLRHHCKCQRRFASTAIQIRRNALFTSSEYAFRALLAFEKCSGPCRASVRAPPFLPIALAASLRGEGFLGFVAMSLIVPQDTTYVC